MINQVNKVLFRLQILKINNQFSNILDKANFVQGKI